MLAYYYESKYHLVISIPKKLKCKVLNIKTILILTRYEL